jgi:S-adenosylmethionine decarboxylase
MGNQKEGFLIVKEKELPAQTQCLRESLVAEHLNSFHPIVQDPPSVARTVKSSLLNTKPQITSPNINRSSLKTTANSYANVNVNKSEPKKNNQRGYRKMKRKVKYGMEVILDLYDCDPKVIRSSKAIASFAIQMCKLLKMKRFGKALTPHFGHDDPKTSGYSLLQFLETSSITGHFSEEWNSAYINIFSCRMFSAKKAIDFTKKYFKTRNAVARKLIRA